MRWVLLKNRLHSIVLFNQACCRALPLVSLPGGHHLSSAAPTLTVASGGEGGGRRTHSGTFKEQQKRGRVAERMLIATSSALVLMPDEPRRKDTDRCAVLHCHHPGKRNHQNSSGNGHNWGQTVGFLTLLNLNEIFAVATGTTNLNGPQNK